MAASHHISEGIARGARMLRTALGPAIATFLEDPGVVEVMLNPDGRLWIDRLSEGLSDTGERLSSEDGERIIRLVAHHVGAEVHTGSPRVSAELPSLDADYYLCGPVAFMAAMQDGLEALGVAGERIHSETFGPATPAVGA